MRYWAHSQSPGAKVNEMGTYSSSTILNTLFLLLSASSLLSADAALRAPDLTIYIFRTTPPAPNATVVAIYPPGLRPPDATPYPVGIPIVSVGDNPIRLTASEKSQIVGRQRVFRVTGITQEDQYLAQSTGVLDLKLNGKNGTISFSGIQTRGLNIPPVEELGVTGGTGAYESASGRAKVTLISNSASKTTLKWEVYLCYPELCRVDSLLN
ncbi:protein MpDIR29 [Marchantia polymorpha subsp. ruderalis]|uniref:Dirigent protein n=2 Tax=Marchantia polymorpha TaxID=3197 RepID=A0AAF6BJQ4_MARPO|nr:hypothetical protein MARPO_0084s0088 [Marchantia polymorpha]BBN12238.1 hypothetical protein Mp_5g18400 [Marchantia polymorpha subsp. ruderalis]|eukprot:PTQ34026.1 hypothetical protein MARPO_0084s0088 [Marchantia polymorpha]